MGERVVKRLKGEKEDIKGSNSFGQYGDETVVSNRLSGESLAPPTAQVR